MNDNNYDKLILVLFHWSKIFYMASEKNYTRYPKKLEPALIIAYMARNFEQQQIRNLWLRIGVIAGSGVDRLEKTKLTCLSKSQFIWIKPT